MNINIFNIKNSILILLFFLIATGSVLAQKKLIVYSDEIYDSEKNTTYTDSKIVFDFINKTYQRTTGNDKFPKYKVNYVKQYWYMGSNYVYYEVSGKGKIEAILINDYSIFELYGYNQWQNFKITSVFKE